MVATRDIHRHQVSVRRSDREIRPVQPGVPVRVERPRDGEHGHRKADSYPKAGPACPALLHGDGPGTPRENGKLRTRAFDEQDPVFTEAADLGDAWRIGRHRRRPHHGHSERAQARDLFLPPSESGECAGEARRRRRRQAVHVVLPGVSDPESHARGGEQRVESAGLARPARDRRRVAGSVVVEAPGQHVLLHEGNSWGFALVEIGRPGGTRPRHPPRRVGEKEKRKNCCEEKRRQPVARDEPRECGNESNSKTS